MPAGQGKKKAETQEQQRASKRAKCGKPENADEHEVPLFDEETLSALRSGSEVFLAGCTPPLTQEKVREAVAIAAANRALEIFGLDGTDVELGPEAAAALGALAVRALDFPLALEFTAEGRAAFKKALAANGVLESLRICKSQLDGNVSGTTWRPEGSPFVADAQRLRKRAQLPPLVFHGGDADEGEGSDEEGSDDHVECDGEACQRQLTAKDAVFVDVQAGRDYCAKCHAGLAEELRSTMRETTAEARIVEDAADSDEGSDDEQENNN